MEFCLRTYKPPDTASRTITGITLALPQGTCNAADGWDPAAFFAGVSELWHAASRQSRFRACFSPAAGKANR